MPPLIGITLAMRRPAASLSRFWQLRHYYTQAVEAGGGIPMLIPLGIGPETLRTLYDRLDGVMISGGGDMASEHYGESPSPHLYHVNRERDRQELQLTRWAVEDDKALLCICRGHQVLNVALGGSLIQHLPQAGYTTIRHDHRTEEWFERLCHPIRIERDTRLADILGQAEIQVNSLHHQAIKEVGSGLRVTAHAPDGVIEAVEMPNKRFVLGVQWHPEALVRRMSEMRSLFQAFVAASG
ncbi:MAG: gamma-glutamyl-gamma-aminobutyrate hydrolase family protein [Chloroflexi bacterium]|nr:gamma-glutamyl-gamma-aminobutyrate hydrolase family protein [Chloroflexota bacterium]